MVGVFTLSESVHPLLRKLDGGDMRSIGRSEEVVAEVLAKTELFDVVFRGMLVDSPLIRMRAADAVEKITARHPEYLRPYKAQLLEAVAAIEQQEVRWHVAQMIPRLNLSVQERECAVGILIGYLEDKSRIVKTFSMQALTDLAAKDDLLTARVTPILEELVRVGSPAMQSRGRKLLAKLRGWKLTP